MTLDFWTTVKLTMAAYLGKLFFALLLVWVILSIGFVLYKLVLFYEQRIYLPRLRRRKYRQD